VLVNMVLDFDLSVPPPSAFPPPWKWRNHHDFSDEELIGVIHATYENSLDCPLLKGLRSGEDIIAAHKSSGKYTPNAWWLADTPDGEPAGCLLVNDQPREKAANIVYLGVTTPHRGKGLGRKMTQHAIAITRRRNLLSLTLAVDSQNIYAVNIYESEGFVKTTQRIAHVFTGQTPKSRSSP